MVNFKNPFFKHLILAPVFRSDIKHSNMFLKMFTLSQIRVFLHYNGEVWNAKKKKTLMSYFLGGMYSISILFLLIISLYIMQFINLTVW